MAKTPALAGVFQWHVAQLVALQPVHPLLPPSVPGEQKVDITRLICFPAQ